MKQLNLRPAWFEDAYAVLMARVKGAETDIVKGTPENRADSVRGVAAALNAIMEMNTGPGGKWSGLDRGSSGDVAAVVWYDRSDRLNFAMFRDLGSLHNQLDILRTNMYRYVVVSGDNLTARRESPYVEDQS